MAEYKNANLKKALSVLKNQQKLYFSGCCRSNNYLDTAEKMINRALLQKIEDLVVEDVMNGGQHDIKNMGNDPSFPILAIDNCIFCSYQTAKKYNLLQSLGCPLEGNYNSVDEGNRILIIIDDLQKDTLKDFVEKHYIGGEYYNGTSRLISMLERLYNPDNFSDDKYSKTEFYGEIKFDNRAMIAAMQFINANTSNQGRYENSALYYGNIEIKGIGADLSFKRSSVSEDFILTGITLKLFADQQCSRYIPFAIAIGANERGAARSFGHMFTETTYPEFADDANDTVPIAVLHVPSWAVHKKACGAPDDKRTLKQFLEDYEKVYKATSSIDYSLRVIRLTATDEDISLGLANKDYCEFITEWRNALDFVQYTTLPYAILRDSSYLGSGRKVVSLLESKEKYVEYLAKLSGGFNSSLCDMLRKKAEYPEMISDNISYDDFTNAAKAAMNCFSNDLNMYCRYNDIMGTLTIPELKELIEETKRIRERLEICDEQLLQDCYKAVAYEDLLDTAFCLL